MQRRQVLPLLCCCHIGAPCCLAICKKMDPAPEEPPFILTLQEAPPEPMPAMSGLYYKQDTPAGVIINTMAPKDEYVFVLLLLPKHHR